MNKKKVTNQKYAKLNNELDFVKFIIHRFEVNDPIVPSYYIIGFKLVCGINQREQYIETIVDYKECENKSDNQICLLAYNKLKDRIDEISTELVKNKFIVGSEFVPPLK